MRETKTKKGKEDEKKLLFKTIQLILKNSGINGNWN